MSIQDQITIVGGALSSIYDSSGKSIRALTLIQQGYEALLERLDAAEDCDELAGLYKDLAKEAIEELRCYEAEAVSYGKAEELQKRFEEVEG
jgi:hypothetical protein